MVDFVCFWYYIAPNYSGKRNMKYKIKTELIVKAMEGSRLEKRVRTVTLNSLRDSGLTRTETDNLTKEDAEFSLATIFIVTNQLNMNPLDVIEDLTLLNESLLMASESRQPHIFMDEHFKEDPHHTLRGNNTSTHYLLQPLSSDEIKEHYVRPGYQESDLSLSSRELTEKMAYDKEKEWYSNGQEFMFDRPYVNDEKNIWINLIDPKTITSESNKNALILFQTELANYAVLQSQQQTTSDTLEGLLGHAEYAVKAKNVDLRTIGKDYQIFYKSVIRKVIIREEAIGNRINTVFSRLEKQRSYSFKYRPLVVDHFFIIAPADVEALLLDVTESKIEKNIIDLSNPDADAKWASGFWCQNWNEAGGIGSIEDDEDIPV